MHQPTVLVYLFYLYGLMVIVRAADKYTDENRPYEFGFTIDGEQHRHEKKDENGIIMGEFGFITADGVYHVTVYATDENGRFKILSMKNIRVKPYPTAVTNSQQPAGDGVKKGHSIPFPPSENSPVLRGPSSSKTSSPQQETKPLQINKQISSPAKSCSHCSLPTTTTKAPPPQLTDIAIVSRDRATEGTSKVPSSSGQSYNVQPGIDKTFSPSYSGQDTNPFGPGLSQNNLNYPKVNSQQDSFGNVQQNYQQQDLSGNRNYQQTQQQNLSGNRNYPSSIPNVEYPQQNNNENSFTSQSNQYYPQNQDTVSQNNPQVYKQNENNDRYNSQKQINTDQNYGQQQTDQIQPEVSSVQSYSGQGISDSLQTPKEILRIQPGVSSGQSYSGQGISDNLQTPKETLRNPKQYNAISNPGTDPSEGFGAVLASQPSQPLSNRPTLVAAQMQIVPKETDIHHRNPGEVEGLPDGLSKDDMTHLLYTFNYTVGFHGHQEEGYSNGAKKGYYFVTGRNGIRTRIDYIADEKGFRPTITTEVLDLLSDDVPKPETEKEEKFGLKGYEFKWIYYPTNEKT